MQLRAELDGSAVKRLPAMHETQVGSLGREDPLEEEKATHSIFLPREFHGQRSLAGYSPWGHEELNTLLSGFPAVACGEGTIWPCACFQGHSGWGNSNSILPALILMSSVAPQLSPRTCEALCTCMWTWGGGEGGHQGGRRFTLIKFCFYYPSTTPKVQFCHSIVCDSL